MKKEISSGPKITYAELMKDLDKYRTKKGSGIYVTMTKEQEKFLIKCKNHKRPVPERKIAELWSQMWGNVSRYVITYRIELLKKQGKINDDHL